MIAFLTFASFASFARTPFRPGKSTRAKLAKNAKVKGIKHDEIAWVVMECGFAMPKELGPGCCEETFVQNESSNHPRSKDKPAESAIK